MSRQSKIKILVFIICYSLIIWRVLFVPATHRNSIFGDGFSDLNSISSAKYFKDFGFEKTKFLPVHEYPSNTGTLVYTHYPAVPNVLAGCYAYIFNSTNEDVLRIIPMLLSMVFFFLIFYVIKDVTKKTNEAFIASVMIVLSNYFIAWADNLHKHLYEEMINWTVFIILYHYHENERKNKYILIWLVLLMIIGINISFEQPVFLGTLVLGFAIVYQKKMFTKEVVVCFTALIVGFAIHLIQNVFYFGSVELMIKDMKAAFLLRNQGIVTGNIVTEEPFSFWHDSWHIPINWFNRMERYFLIPGWAMIVIGYLGLKQLYIENIKMFKIIMICIFAGISWGIIMPQHEFIHVFTNRHFALAYAFILVFGLPAYYTRLKLDFKEKKVLFKIGHIIFLIYILMMFVSQQFFDLYLRNGFLFNIFHKS